MSTWTSKYFTLPELLRSRVAEKNGISNMPDELASTRLAETAIAMDLIRSLLGTPIRVTSAYRSPALNKAINGSKTSAHCLGYAVDFVVDDQTPYQVCLKILKSDIRFDQLIHEFGSWTHISFDPRFRMQTLTIADKKYVEGIREVSGKKVI